MRATVWTSQVKSKYVVWEMVVWHDLWVGGVPFSKYISNRVMYEERMDTNMKVDGEVWKWPMGYGQIPYSATYK